MVEAPVRSPNPITTDRHDVFEVLSNERRRLIMETLLEADQPMPLTALVDRIATAESVGRESAADSRRSIAMGLHHVHLPMLELAELVVCDYAHELVSAADVADTVVHHLARVRDESR